MEPEDDRADRLFAALEGETAKEAEGLRRLRAWSTRARLGAWLAVVAVLLAGVVALLGIGGIRGASSFWAVGGLAAVATVAIRRALRPLQRRLWPLDAPAALVGMLVFGAVAMLLPSDVGLAPAYALGPCVVIAAAVAVPTFVVGALLDRDPPQGMAFAALAAALVGTLASQTVCPKVDVAHVLTNHVAALLTLTVALVAVGMAARLGRRGGGAPR
jgi:hypothetical protein